MFWIPFLYSSIWLGYNIIPFFHVNDLNFISRLFTSWLIGYSISSILIFILTIILPLNLFLILILILIQSILAIFLQKKNQKSPFNFEKNPWFYVFILFTLGFSLKHLSKVYLNIPYSCPYSMRSIMDREIGFINSVLYGINKKRSNPLFFSDPMISNHKFSSYSLPLLFTAGIMAGGLSYGSASLIICLINILSTAYSIYQFSKKFTKWPTLSSFLFLFSGSWASILYFKSSRRIDLHNDLVHQISKNHETVMYQIFAHLLSLSKSLSFSISFAQYAILWQPSILSGVLAALTPSLITSFATFGLLSGIPHNLNQILPFTVTLLIRLYPFNLMYKPLFREAEMRGTFFAPAIIWFVALGPIFIILAGFSWFLPRNRFKFYFIYLIF